MANEPKVLNVNGYQTPTEKVSGGHGTSSATVSSAPKELQKSEQSQVGVDLTNVKGTATGNTEERSLKVSKDAAVGSYVADTNRAGDPGRTKRSIVNTITVNEAKLLIKKSAELTLAQVNKIVETVRKGMYVKVDTTEYATLEDFLASNGEEGAVYLYPVGNEANNYYQYIWETLPTAGWISLGTTQLDISNLVDLTSDQTIIGVKKIGDSNHPFIPLKFHITDSYDWRIGVVSGNSFDIARYAAGDIFQYGYNFANAGFAPKTNNDKDLGSSANKWKDFYLSGVINIAHSTSSSIYHIEMEQYGKVFFSRTYNNNKITYFIWDGNAITPRTNGGSDLGNSNTRFLGIYTQNLNVSGNITDGTNSVNAAELKALIDYAKSQGWIS